MAGGKHFKKPVSENGLEADEGPAVAAPEPGRESAPEPAPADDEPDFFDTAPSGDESSVFSTIYQGFDAAAPASTDGELIRVRKRRKHRRSKRPFIIAGVICALVVAVLGCGTAFAYSAYGVYQDAQAVIAQADNLSAGLTEGDSEALEEAAASIQESASSMAAAVDGPLWSVAGALPFVGTDVQNIRELVGVLDTLATEVLAPVAEQADSISLGAVFVDGAINVEVVGQLAQLVVDVAPAVSEATTTVQELEEGSIEQVNSVVEQLVSAMETVDALCSGLSELAPYLEDMLGANGARTYLILAHNTSELKSSGGFTGAVGTLTITNGSFDLGDFGSFNEADRDADDYGSMENRVEVTDEEDAIFTWTWGVHAGSSGSNPDFSREAEVSKEMWESYYGGAEIDGVIALDSEVLASFLSLTGSVTTSDGTVVSSSNCVEVLGYDIYWEYFSDASYTSTSNDEADALFAEVAELAFDSIMENIGSVSLTGLVDVLASCAGDYRLLIWMDDSEEEAALESLGVSGTINTDETVPLLGVFLDMRTPSKLSWWAEMDTTYVKSLINGDGSVTYTVTTTIANTITEEEIEESSIYIHGKRNGAIDYVLYLYAPAGGSIADVEASVETTDLGYYTLNGNEVAKVRFIIDPESTVTITYSVTVSPEAVGSLQIRSTPLAQTTSAEVTTE